MSEEILKKIDRVLDRIDVGNNKTTKEDVLIIIDLLRKECPEDKVLLLQTEYIVNGYWHIDRKRIKENLDFVLNYFNILKDPKFTIEFRKTYAKKVHNCISKTIFKPKNKNYILELLSGVENK
jgi:hypothetical protein